MSRRIARKPRENSALDPLVHAAHQAIQDEMVRLVVAALDELLTETARKPEHRAELVDVFARTLLDSVTAHSAYLVKCEAIQQGVDLRPN
jgi:hypothetical protein